MLQRIITVKHTDIEYMDASDALAVAVCHHFQDNPLLKTGGPKAKGWGEFIAKNPGRIG